MDPRIPLPGNDAEHIQEDETPAARKGPDNPSAGGVAGVKGKPWGRLMKRFCG
jgi:hypothetical protein